MTDLKLHRSTYSPISTGDSPLACSSSLFNEDGRCYSPSTLLPFGYARSHAEACRVNDSAKFRQLPCRTFISTGMCPYRDRCVYLHDPRVALVETSRFRIKKKNREDIVLDSLFWPVMPMDEIQFNRDQEGNIAANQMYAVPTPREDKYKSHDQAIFSLWHHFVCHCEMRHVASDFEQKIAHQPSFHHGPAQVCASKLAFGPHNPSVTVNNSSLRMLPPPQQVYAEHCMQGPRYEGYSIREYNQRKFLLPVNQSSIIHSKYVNNAFTNRKRLAVFMNLSNGHPILETDRQTLSLQLADGLPPKYQQENDLGEMQHRSTHHAVGGQDPNNYSRMAPKHDDDIVIKCPRKPLSLLHLESTPNRQDLSSQCDKGSNSGMCAPSPATIMDYHPSPVAHRWIQPDSFNSESVEQMDIDSRQVNDAHLPVFPPAIGPLHYHHITKPVGKKLTQHHGRLLMIPPQQGTSNRKSWSLFTENPSRVTIMKTDSDELSMLDSYEDCSYSANISNSFSCNAVIANKTPANMTTFQWQDSGGQCNSNKKFNACGGLAF